MHDPDRLRHRRLPPLELLCRPARPRTCRSGEAGGIAAPDDRRRDTARHPRTPGPQPADLRPHGGLRTLRPRPASRRRVFLGADRPRRRTEARFLSKGPLQSQRTAALAALRPCATRYIPDRLPGYIPDSWLGSSVFALVRGGRPGPKRIPKNPTNCQGCNRATCQGCIGLHRVFSVSDAGVAENPLRHGARKSAATLPPTGEELNKRRFINRARRIARRRLYPTVIERILPGSRGGSPLGKASMWSMPAVTSPHRVYWLSRWGASARQMKNWLLAELGLPVRAMEQAPRRCGSCENSAGRLGFFEPPLPVPVGSPPWAMKPPITRWKTTPS